VAGDIEARRFIDNFDELVTVVGSSDRLRDVVLHLAVTGCLSGTHGDSSEALVKQLHRRRADLAKTGIRVEADSLAIPQDEVPYAIPTQWRWVRARDLGGFLGGGTPAKSNASYWTGKIPWVSPKDMKRLWIEDAADHISLAAIDGSAAKLIPMTSVLYVVRGMILAHSFPVAVTTREVTINQDMKALVLAMPEMAAFVLMSLRAARARVLSMVERSTHGTCRLPSERVEMLPIALPPIAEQKRIVAKVDQLMGLIDELEAKQTKKREVQTRFRTSALDALAKAEGPEQLAEAWKRVAGNWIVLFEQPESVDGLRRSILGLGLGGWQSNRHQWIHTTLGQLAAFVTSGSRNWKNYYAESGAIFVRSQDIKTDALDLSSPAYVSLSGRVEGTRTQIQQDDILITITGANVGKAAHVDQEISEAYVSQHVALVRLHDPSLAPWVHCWLISPENGRGQLLGSSYGDKPGLNLAQVKSVSIAVPPAQERREILDRIGHLLDRCNDLEAKLKAKEGTASKLVEAVVKELVA